MRVGLVVIISEESWWQKGFGKDEFNVLKLGANSFCHCLNKVPFLLQ
jgi:hypothetical protein